MRWNQSRRSTNVQDRRGMSGGMRIGGGAGILLIVVVALLGGDPRQVLQMLGGGSTGAVAPSAPPADDPTAQFLSAVLGMTEDAWGELFAASGATYDPPTMVLFSGSVQSACGFQSAATGPFYCPPDRSLFLDATFFDELSRMGGAGDFAQAYVVGHEVGHHVQTLTGTSDRVRSLQGQTDQAGQNGLQVLMELQADCYAGVFAYHANQRQQVLEPGDVEEGLAAAAAIGDDRLQSRAGREVTPESFTHGSSADRQRWLMRGLESGSPGACDTFADAGIDLG